MQSLDAGYNPQRQSINQQIDRLPSQAAAQTAGLQAQQTTAFDSITNQARDRGMGFSGIPLQEQAKYTADNYLPAVAKVQESQNNAKTSLTDALNGVNLQQRTQAYGQQNDQLNREESARQFDAQQAAALARQNAANSGSSDSLAGLFGGGDTPATADPNAGAAPAASPMANVTKRSNNSYGFTNHNGQAINALDYANAIRDPKSQLDFRKLLQSMADGGDVGARTGLGFIGKDGRADPTKITNPAIANLYKALTGQNIGVYKAPVSAHNQVVNAARGVVTQFNGPSKVQAQLNAARAAGKVR